MKQNQPPVVTVAHQFYNSEYGSLQLKFMNRKAVIGIAAIIEDMKGKKARRGAIMYDYDNSVGMAMNVEELVKLKYSLDGLVSGEIKELRFTHTFGESIKNLVFGVGYDDESPNLQIYMEELERSDPNEDPLLYAWYEFAPYEGGDVNIKSLEVEVFKEWIDSAIRVSFLEASHTQQLNNYGSPINTGNYQRGGGSDGGYQQRRPSTRGAYGRTPTTQHDDGYDDTPPETPPVGGTRRQPTRPAPGGKRPAPGGNPMPGPDDDIPF